MTTVYEAPAKINLGLEVLYKRPDGYHEINTIFYKVYALCDSLEVERAETFSFTCSSAALGASEDNLVVRAARLWDERTGEMPKLHVHLEKRIPFGAGLGGGSSDAAQMLKACNAQAAARLSLDELMQLGLRLGADVPFFLLESRCAIGEGVGDELTSNSLELPHHLLIVKADDISVNTADAYRALQLEGVRAATNYRLFDRSRLSSSLSLLTNDFEEPVFAMHPRLKLLKERLYKLGATFAQMTGSGAALYALFDKRSTIQEAESTLRSEGLFTAIEFAKNSEKTTPVTF